MLEKLFAQAKNGFQKQSQKWLPAFSSGVWIVIALTMLVGGRLLWVKASRPAHRQAIADAFGSDSQFFDDAQLNHDGSRLTYVSTSDKGWGVFLYDQTTSHKQLICEQKQQSDHWNFFDLNAWPWSPDDKSFIYSAGYTLFVCSIDSGQVSQSPGIQASGPVAIPAEGRVTCFTSVVWVNPSEFAYLFDGVIGYARKRSDGQWITHRLPYGELPQAGGASCLTAASDDSIAWLMNGSICRARLTEDANDPFTITPATANAQRQLETNIRAVTFGAPPAIQPPADHLFFWGDAATLEQSNQSPVLRLADLSPGKNDLIPDGKAPIYNAPDSPRALNGRGTVHFSLNGSVTNASGLRTITSLGITNNTPRTVFAVMRRDAGRQILLSMGDDSSVGSYFGLCDQNDGLYLPSVGGESNQTAPSDGSWMITEVVYDGTNQTGYVNGRLRGRTTFSLNTADSELELGLRTAAINTVGSDGDFAELLVYDQALSPAARQQVENYLNLKWFGNTLLLPGNPAVWCEPRIPGMVSFNYSKQNRQFLIRSMTDNYALWRFDPKSDEATQITKGGPIWGEQWAGSENCAYISYEPPHKRVAVADAFGTGATRWYEPQNLDWCKATEDGQKLFFGGTISNEPSAEIGQIDLDSGQMRTAVSYADHPSIYAQNASGYEVSMFLPAGRVVQCTVYPPAHFNPHKKYPLVIGDTPFRGFINGPHGTLWMPAITTCGAFVIYTDRVGWWQDMEQWEENVKGVYQVMANDPCIDKERVFLFGTSAETRYLSKCLADSPSLWRGAIFLNPGGPLPDFSKSSPFQPRPKILISAGGDEHEEYWIKQYQTDALKSGVMVDYVIHPDEGHLLIGNAAHLELIQAISHFVLEE
jgi:hypothetical protein